MDEGKGGVDTKVPVRVLIVDDHRTFGEALALVLEADPRLDCCGVATSVPEALQRLSRDPCDVVIMDVALPGSDGIEGTRRIRSAHPETRVIILTGHVEPSVLAAAVSVGAAAFLPKGGRLADVVEAVLAPPGGSMIIGPQTPLPVISEAMRLRGTAGRTRPRNGLTERELEVLEMLGEGLSPAAIADDLGITMHTCRGHIKSLLAKLHVHSQLEAVVHAWQSGLIHPPEQRTSDG